MVILFKRDYELTNRSEAHMIEIARNPEQCSHVVQPPRFACTATMQADKYLAFSLS